MVSKADAALMMQLGCDGGKHLTAVSPDVAHLCPSVFVGSGIFLVIRAFPLSVSPSLTNYSSVWRSRQASSCHRPSGKLNL